ncbi:MAG: transglycosylase SLT domain-containing protein [Vampirovibrionales bacterium]|nr:transglycosylase SLT domain-containing protein [Vampirovibrionales bacterium]
MTGPTGFKTGYMGLDGFLTAGAGLHTLGPLVAPPPKAAPVTALNAFSGLGGLQGSSAGAGNYMPNFPANVASGAGVNNPAAGAMGGFDATVNNLYRQMQLGLNTLATQAKAANHTPANTQAGPINPADVQGMTSSKTSKGQAIIAAAQKLGVKPEDLAAIIMFESGGNPTIWGGDGGNYFGLIQFGPEEKKKHVDPLGEKGKTFEGQMEAVISFFKERGLPNGANLETMYKTVLTGSPNGNGNSADSNGTTATGAANGILQAKKQEGIKAFGLA